MPTVRRPRICSRFAAREAAYGVTQMLSPRGDFGVELQGRGQKSFGSVEELVICSREVVRLNAAIRKFHAAKAATPARR